MHKGERNATKKRDVVELKGSFVSRRAARHDRGSLPLQSRWRWAGAERLHVAGGGGEGSVLAMGAENSCCFPFNTPRPSTPSASSAGGGAVGGGGALGGAGAVGGRGALGGFQATRRFGLASGVSQLQGFGVYGWVGFKQHEQLHVLSQENDSTFR